MHLLLLGGQEKKTNKDWVKKVEKALKEYFDSSHVHEYKHWQTDEDFIEIEHEIESVMKHIKDKDDKDYVIFAKSAGAILTLKAICEGKLTPKKCIFAGIAVNWARKQNLAIDDWIKCNAVPTLYFQKTGDPAFSFAELSSWLLLSGGEKYKTVEFPGKDHHYEDIESIKREVTNFLFALE
jgi:hypothetical protein